MTDATVCPAEIESAAKRIEGIIVRTPLEKSPLLSRMYHSNVFVKHEHMQHSGAFKLRGAANHMSLLTEEQISRGVCCASTGNHGVSTAYCAQRLGIEATVILCDNVPQMKIDMIECYGAKYEIVKGWCIDAEERCRALEESGMYYIPPYNAARTVNGQGTCGLEIYQQMTKLGETNVDCVFCVIGGGGLISGIGTYIKHKYKGAKLYGVSSERTTAMYSSLKAGRILQVDSEPSVAHGNGGNLEEGAITFGLCQSLLEEIILVSDEEITSAVRQLAELERTLVEPTAALGLAGFIRKHKELEGKTVVVVTCGRNVQFEEYCRILSRGM